MPSDEGSSVGIHNVGKVMPLCMYKGPGPAVYQLRPLVGAHNHCKSKPQAPAYTIGQPYKFKVSDTPGPGYNYHYALTVEGKKETPAFSISGRPAPRGIEQLPGPGAYDTKPVSDGPRIAIGLPVRSPFKNEAPAPNKYNVKSGIGTTTSYEPTTPAWGVRSRSFVGSTYYDTVKAGVPGPAEYGVTENRIVYPTSGPVSIKSRTNYQVDPLQSARFKDAPGPGTYNPDTPRGKRGFAMGVRHSAFVMPLITNQDMFY